MWGYNQGNSKVEPEHKNSRRDSLQDTAILNNRHMTCTGVLEPQGFSRSCAAAKAKTPPTRTTTQSVPRWSSECSASCHVQHRARVGRTKVQDAAAMDYAFGFPIQYRGPEPNLATRSPGLASWQRSNDRHPHPMHWVSPCLRRSSSAMRSLMRLLQFPESLAQSARSGTRLLGSLDNSSRISSSDSPIF